MKINNTGVFIAILILIVMLIICHTTNTLYPRSQNKHNNKYNNKHYKQINMFNNVLKPLPTQYNIITYNKQNTKIPCGDQAQIPCKIIQQQNKCNTKDALNPNELSDSEIALLYKAAYELAGNEVLLRSLNKK